MDDGAVELKVLGITVLRDADGVGVPLTVAERRLLSGLAMAGRTAVVKSRLCEIVWGSDPNPSTAEQSLYNHISRVSRDACARRTAAQAAFIGWSVPAANMMTAVSTKVMTARMGRPITEWHGVGDDSWWSRCPAASVLTGAAARLAPCWPCSSRSISTSPPPAA